MQTDPLESLVRRAKGLDGQYGAAIPIVDEHHDVIGSLTAIDPHLADDDDIASALTRWRQRFMRFFLTQFDATPERTKAWLKNVVVPDNSRILFLIRDETGNPVGNFGVCGIAPGQAELDNLIRGEKGGHARLIYFAEISLVGWLYQCLAADRIFLRVFSNNPKTIALHESVGFSRSSSSPLVERKIDGGVAYDVVEQQSDIPAGPHAPFELVTMKLDRSRFYEMHPWMNPQRP